MSWPWTRPWPGHGHELTSFRPGFDQKWLVRPVRVGPEARPVPGTHHQYPLPGTHTQYPGTPPTTRHLPPPVSPVPRVYPDTVSRLFTRLVSENRYWDTVYHTWPTTWPTDQAMRPGRPWDQAGHETRQAMSPWGHEASRLEARRLEARRLVDLKPGD